MWPPLSHLVRPATRDAGLGKELRRTMSRDELEPVPDQDIRQLDRSFLVPVPDAQQRNALPRQCHPRCELRLRVGFAE